MSLQRDVPFASWPEHVRTVFAVLGKAMRSDRLYPETLDHMPKGDGAILRGHRVEITHISGAQLEKRKGRYVIQIEGPIFAGSWGFSSGELEALACQARASGVISDAAEIASPQNKLVRTIRYVAAGIFAAVLSVWSALASVAIWSMFPRILDDFNLPEGELPVWMAFLCLLGLPVISVAAALMAVHSFHSLRRRPVR